VGARVVKRPVSGSRRRANPPGPRYTLPTARAARVELLGELRRHGFATIHRLYAAGEIREKRVASMLGFEAERADAVGDPARAKVARGVMLLAAVLHEGKHTRPASADALRVFWSHMDRVHGVTPHGRRRP